MLVDLKNPLSTGAVLEKAGLFRVTASPEMPFTNLPRWEPDMGRKAHIADPTHRRQAEAMAAYGVPESDIARVIGIDPKTLRRHYRDELDTGHVKAAAKVAESLYRKALGDGSQSVTAAIFWLKTRAGWKETTSHEIAGRDGRPIETSDVTPRELAKAIVAVLATATVVPPSPSRLTAPMAEAES